MLCFQPFQHLYVHRHNIHKAFNSAQTEITTRDTGDYVHDISLIRYDFRYVSHICHIACHGTFDPAWIITLKLKSDIDILSYVVKQDKETIKSLPFPIKDKIVAPSMVSQSNHCLLIQRVKPKRVSMTVSGPL
ncbi:hypothetical protein BMS3Abin07_02322 [bacterium BMS3Abin07]|nr:hypothetical protein BMS3Abin07_02322 [bacterium BMS3Abin07]GBE31316.1 hypothetical protein BMS3Bbin05_00216 [bacterium BMS3Bbin05]